MIKVKSSTSCLHLKMWMIGNLCKKSSFLENIKGKLCADKGYIEQALFEEFRLKRSMTS